MPELQENTELDARFIEQEHRFLRVLSNLYETRSLASTDSRRRAAVRAAIWRMFSPSTVAVAGGGAVAIRLLGSGLAVRGKSPFYAAGRRFGNQSTRLCFIWNLS